MNTTVHTPDSAPTPSYPLVTGLTAVRKSKQMTQAELANAAGLSRMTVQRLESNGLDPRLSTLQEMARVLEQDLVMIPLELRGAFEQWLQERSAP
jgi:transcriptional regulator with XRE-family HTH domain